MADEFLASSLINEPAWVQEVDYEDLPERLRAIVDKIEFPLHHSTCFEQKLHRRNMLFQRDRKYFSWICRNMFLFWDTINLNDRKKYKNEIVEITLKWFPTLVTQSKNFTSILFQLYQQGNVHFNKTIYINVRNGYSYYEEPQKFDKCGTDYEFHTVLGKGGFGTVWKVTEKSTGKSYACKQLNTKKMKTKAMELLDNEINLMASLYHRQVIQFHGCWRVKENFYILCDYYTGTDLRKLLAQCSKKGKRIGIKYVKNVAKQMLLALQYIHDQGITHADIKPENIMFREPRSSHIIIIDFGLSLAIRVTEGSNRIAGTPHYMAPEIWKGKIYGSGVDIWAMGVIMFEMLMGYLPFSAPPGVKDIKTIAAVICNGLKDQNDGRGPWIPLNMITPDAESFISSCLTVNRAQRSTAQELHNHPWLDIPSEVERPGKTVLATLTIGYMSKLQKLVAQAHLSEISPEIRLRLRKFCIRNGLGPLQPLTQEKYVKILSEYTQLTKPQLIRNFASSGLREWTMDDMFERLSYNYILDGEERVLAAMRYDLIKKQKKKIKKKDKQRIPLFQITKDHFIEIASCSDYDEEEIIQIEEEIYGDREEISSHEFYGRLSHVPDTLDLNLTPREIRDLATTLNYDTRMSSIFSNVNTTDINTTDGSN